MWILPLHVVRPLWTRLPSAQLSYFKLQTRHDGSSRALSLWQRSTNVPPYSATVWHFYDLSVSMHVCGISAFLLRLLRAQAVGYEIDVDGSILFFFFYLFTNRFARSIMKPFISCEVGLWRRKRLRKNSTVSTRCDVVRWKDLRQKMPLNKRPHSAWMVSCALDLTANDCFGLNAITSCQRVMTPGEYNGIPAIEAAVTTQATLP